MVKVIWLLKSVNNQKNIPTRLDGMLTIYVFPLLPTEAMNITMRTKTRLIEKGDFTFYNITDIKLEVDAKKMTTQFDNLFGGNNKEIERSTNESFNKNWRDFFEALRPLITDTVNKIMSDLLPPLFLMYPANFFVGDVPTSQKLYGTKE